MATIVAAAMAFVTGTLLERSKRRHSLRNEAYAEYLSAVARSTSAPPSDRSKVLTDAALAKCKIVIHGSDRVIEALKAFELCGAVSSSEEGQDGLLDLVVAIRGSVGVDRNDLRVLLLGEQPQKPQPSPLPEWPHAPPPMAEKPHVPLSYARPPPAHTVYGKPFPSDRRDGYPASYRGCWTKFSRSRAQPP
jgi:hypothetical protein